MFSSAEPDILVQFAHLSEGQWSQQVRRPQVQLTKSLELLAEAVPAGPSISSQIAAKQLLRANDVAEEGYKGCEECSTTEGERKRERCEG